MTCSEVGEGCEQPAKQKLNAASVSRTSATMLSFYAGLLVSCLQLAINVNQVGGLSTVAFWDQQSIDVKQGDNVTVTCTVTGLGLLDIVRLVHTHESKTLLIADNDDIKTPISKLGRYRVLYHVVNGTATLVLQIHGIRGEDSGLLACHHLVDDVNVAHVNINVRVPIKDVYIMAMTSEGDEVRLDDGSDIVLQQHDQLGIGCSTTIDGTTHVPRVNITVAGHDVTHVFERTTDQRPVLLESGLTLFHLTVRLTLITSRPEPNFNGKVMTCTAKGQNGYSDVTASAGLVIYFEPVITCDAYDLSAAVGETVTISCTVKANPGSRLTWLPSNGDVADLHNDPTIRLSTKTLSSDESQISMKIKRVLDGHYGNYTLRADNFIGSSMVTVSLVRRKYIATKPPRIRGLEMQQDAVVGSAGNHPRAVTAPSRGQRLDVPPVSTVIAVVMTTANMLMMFSLLLL